jgi:flotillin
MEIEVVERRKLIEVEEKEIMRKEKELIAIVRRPAEAEAYRMELIAEGNRSVTTANNCHNMPKTRLLGENKTSEWGICIIMGSAINWLHCA